MHLSRKMALFFVVDWFSFTVYCELMDPVA